MIKDNINYFCIVYHFSFQADIPVPSPTVPIEVVASKVADANAAAIDVPPSAVKVTSSAVDPEAVVVCFYYGKRLLIKYFLIKLLL